uniref:EF-hand domain-containing protein n=1 Tax=Alexandrium andersonii TaxID=327968 RepID=A0A7S2CJH1_9DINO|mmetsp:Transcript_39778/g.90451  ORF Transcript_39778/g.90451 Transcript_39778/m.90451 type:complete len:245 (+) Transcript_39778:1-735(+)
MRERSDMRRLFKLMDVSDDLDSTTLFKMLDVREQGTLTCEDLSEGLLRLRGSRRRIHLLMLQRDILQRHRREAKRVAELEENLRERTRAELSAVEDAVVAKLATLQQSILASRDVQGASTVVTERCSEKLVHDTPPMVVGKVVEVGAALAKQPDGMEETTLNLLKGEAETTKVCGGFLQGDLPQKPGCSAECDAMAPQAAKSDPLRAQPWMQEAGGRLEALIQELDSLHSWAEDLVVPVPPSPA